VSVLEFIAAIKWPVFLLVLLGVTVRGAKKHPEVSARVAAYFEKRDISGKAGPVEFQATSKDAVEQAAAVSAASDEVLAASTFSFDLGDLFTEPPPDPTVMRRDAVEDVMRLSAQWGWEAAQMGFRSPPNPHIEWSEDGRPEIKFGAGTGVGVSHTYVVGEDDRANAAERNRRAAMQQAIWDRMERQHGEDDRE
jgi:hypothetical protein